MRLRYLNYNNFRYYLLENMTGSGNVFGQIAAAFLLQHYTVMEQSEAVVNAVKFDFTWLGAIISVVILVVVLMLNVEKYADQYRKERN